jgi:glutaredoxin-related protein
MNRTEILQEKYKDSLKIISEKNNIDYSTMEILLTAEKTKKFLKRRSSIQETIDREIENSII